VSRTDETEPSVGDDDDKGKGNVLSRIARRLQNPRELSGDAKELLGAIVDTSDRAKTEMVKLVAREVRNYLQELRLRDDLHALLTGHSLEVKMSLSLKPLRPTGDPNSGAQGSSVDPRREAE
jgi:hypothetical protein